MVRPLCIDLFCGLGGWAEGFLAEGYDVIGFDIERHRYPAFAHSEPEAVKVSGLAHGTFPPGGLAQCRLNKRGDPIGWCEYPGQLVLQDVLTLHGSQFRNAAVIVASPPCQAYSYRAMPWKRAKALPPPDNTLFDACFRIQREASEAAGRYIPLVVENVCGAQKWVGRAAWHFGSFYLWRDVPALMPHTLRTHNKNGASVKWRENGCNEENRMVPSRPREAGGINQNGSGPEWFDIGLCKAGSHSSARKQASAEIAKIPFDLANHIARVYRPDAIRTDSVCNGVEPLDFGEALHS